MEINFVISLMSTRFRLLVWSRADSGSALFFLFLEYLGSRMRLVVGARVEGDERKKITIECTFLGHRAPEDGLHPRSTNCMRSEKYSIKAVHVENGMVLCLACCKL